MARRSDHTRAETAALIIAATRSIIAAEGTRGVTMRRIAADIGYVPGTIYNALGDLDTVLLRVNADTLQRLSEPLQTAIAGNAAGDAIAIVVAVAEAYIDFVIANGSLWAALLENPPRPDSPVPIWYAEPRNRLIEIVAGLLTPLFPEDRARRRAVIALWAALQGVASLAAGGNFAFAASGVDTHDLARSITRRYLTGQEE